MTDCKGDNEGTRALMAQIDSLVVQRDAAEALVREEKEMADEAIKQRNQWLSEMHAATARAEKAEARLERIRLECIGALTAEGQYMLVDSDPTASGEVSRAIHRLGDEKRKSESRESELGLQVEAQKARLRLATAVCDALRRAEAREAEGYDGFGDYYDATAALAAWDAVPGDGEVIRSALAGRGDRNS